MEYRINVNPHVKQLLKKALEPVFYIYMYIYICRDFTHINITDGYI